MTSARPNPPYREPVSPGKAATGTSEAEPREPEPAWASLGEQWGIHPPRVGGLESALLCGRSQARKAT